MNGWTKKAVVLCVLSVVSSYASAELFFNQEVKAAPSTVVPQSVSVGQSGMATQASSELLAIGFVQQGMREPATILNGYAKNIALLVALKQIVPDGWRARKIGEVDVTRLVSWTGGKRWTDVLSQLSDDYEVNVLVDWDRKEIVLNNEHKAAPVAQNAQMGNYGDAVPYFGGNPQLNAATKSPIAGGRQKEWVLQPGISLRKNIELWAKQTGVWTVSWSAGDYPVTARAVFYGEMNEKSGPLATLIRLYADAEIPLTVEMYEDNHVIRVENKKPELKEVPESSVEETLGHSVK